MEDPEHSMVSALGSNGADVDTEPASPVEVYAPPPGPAPGQAPVQAPVQAAASAQPAINPAITKAVDDVLYSDIGVNTLLARLKQSIASARVRQSSTVRFRLKLTHLLGPGSLLSNPFRN